MTTRRLPPMDPWENPVVEFDFAGLLDAVDSAAVLVAVVQGADPTPGNILSGAHQIIGAKVYQRVNGGVSGTSYKLTCRGTGGVEQRVIVGVLPVQTA